MLSTKEPAHISSNQHSGKIGRPKCEEIPQFILEFNEDPLVIPKSVLPWKIVRKNTASSVAIEKDKIMFNSRALSRNHAQIFFAGGHFYCQDMGSSNGTWINNIKLLPERQESEPVKLIEGDVLRFGIDFEDETGEPHSKVQVTFKPFTRQSSSLLDVLDQEIESSNHFNSTLERIQLDFNQNAEMLAAFLPVISESVKNSSENAAQSWKEKYETLVLSTKTQYETTSQNNESLSNLSVQNEKLKEKVKELQDQVEQLNQELATSSTVEKPPNSDLTLTKNIDTEHSVPSDKNEKQLIQTLNDQNKVLSYTVDCLQSRTQDYENALTTTKEQIQSTAQLVDTLSVENKCLLEKLKESDLQGKQISELEEKLKISQEENKDLKEKIILVLNDAEAKENESRNKILLAKRELDELSSESNALRKEVSELKKCIEEHKISLISNLDDLAEIRKKYAELKEANEKITLDLVERKCIEDEQAKLLSMNEVKVIDLGHLVESIQSENKILYARVEQENNENKKSKEKVQELQAVVESFQIERESSQNEIVRLSNLDKQAQLSLKGMEDQIRAHIDEKDNLLKESENFKSNFEAQSIEFTQSRIFADRKVSDLLRENNALITKIEQMEETHKFEIQEQAEYKDALLRDKQELTNRLESLAPSHESVLLSTRLKDQIQSMESKISILESRNQTLEEQISNHTSSLETERMMYESIIQGFKNSLIQEREQLETMDKLHHDLISQNTKLSETIAENHILCTQQQDTITQLRDAIDALNSIEKELVQELEVVNGNFREALKDIKSAQVELAHFQEKEGILKLSISEKVASLEALEKKCSSILKERDAMEERIKTCHELMEKSFVVNDDLEERSSFSEKALLDEQFKTSEQIDILKDERDSMDDFYAHNREVEGKYEVMDEKKEKMLGRMKLALIFGVAALTAYSYMN